MVYDDFLKRHGLVNDDERIVFIRSTIMNAFFTELVNDDEDNYIFLQELSDAACEAMLELGLN